MRGLAAAVLALLLGGTAVAGVEVLGVESATGGVFRPGRFSPIRIRLRASPGQHEIRGRFETDRIAVTRFESVGGEETVSLALLPEREVTSVEIDAGDGFEAHDLRLRIPGDCEPVVGVLEPLIRDPGIGAWRRELGWHEIVLPRDGGSAVLRDTCDLVIERAPGPSDPAPRLLTEAGGARTGGTVVGHWLADRMAGAAARPERARAALAPLAVAVVLLIGVILYGRRRGWPRGIRVLVVAGLSAGVVIVWLMAVAPGSRPRVAARGFSLVRADGSRTDLVVFAARGSVTTDLRAPAGMLLRPIEGPTGRVAPYVLENGRVLRGVELGHGKLAFTRLGRGWARVWPVEPVVVRVEDAFRAESDRGWWLGRVDLEVRVELPSGRGEPLASIWDRFRETTPTRPLGDRGRLLRRIARPATRSGIYGFLVTPPELSAKALGVESTEIRWAMLVP